MRCCDFGRTGCQDAQGVGLNRGGADVARSEAEGAPNLVFDLDGSTHKKLVSEGGIERVFSESWLSIMAGQDHDLALIQDLLAEGLLQRISVAWSKKPKWRNHRDGFEDAVLHTGDHSQFSLECLIALEENTAADI